MQAQAKGKEGSLRRLSAEEPVRLVSQKGVEVTLRRNGKGEDSHGEGGTGKSWGTQEVLDKCLFSSPKEGLENTGKGEAGRGRGTGRKRQEAIRGDVNCLAYSRCSIVACFLSQERADGAELKEQEEVRGRECKEIVWHIIGVR